MLQISMMSKSPTKTLRLCGSTLKLSEKLVPNLIKAGNGKLEAEKTLRPTKSFESALCICTRQKNTLQVWQEGELVLQAKPELATVTVPPKRLPGSIQATSI